MINDYLDDLLDRKEQLQTKLSRLEATIESIRFRLSYVPEQTRDEIIQACDKAAYTYASMAVVKGKLARVDTEIELYEEA